MIIPLRKCRKSGAVYVRPPSIEAAIISLLNLSKGDIASRCEIRDSKSPLYVPTECVLHLLRAERQKQEDAYYKRVWKELVGRFLRQLPKAAPGADTESLAKAAVREKALEMFNEWLADDYLDYSEKLDFFECRFQLGVKALRIDLLRAMTREESRKTALESDDGSGEISAEVERAIASYDPFDLKIIDIADYRFALTEAIDNLPELQKRILHMIMLGIPIETIDLEAQSISKVLGKSEKTIRNHRDKAYETLRRKLKGDH